MKKGKINKDFAPHVAEEIRTVQQQEQDAMMERWEKRKATDHTLNPYR